MKKNKLNFTKFYLTGILALFLLLGLYIFQVNAEVKEKHSLGRSKETIAKLSLENKDLEIWLARKESLEDLSREVEKLNFVKIDKIDYIQIIDSSVVVK